MQGRVPVQRCGHLSKVAFLKKITDAPHELASEAPASTRAAILLDHTPRMLLFEPSPQHALLWFAQLHVVQRLNVLDLGIASLGDRDDDAREV